MIATFCVEGGKDGAVHGLDGGLNALLGLAAHLNDDIRRNGCGFADLAFFIGVESETGAIFTHSVFRPFCGGEGLHLVVARREAQTRIQSVIKQMNATILPSLDAASQEELQRWLAEKHAAMKVE